MTWVRVVLGEDGPACDAHGVVHHRPAARRVTLRTATALIAAGVPAVIRRHHAGQQRATKVSRSA